MYLNGDLYKLIVSGLQRVFGSGLIVTDTFV